MKHVCWVLLVLLGVAAPASSGPSDDRRKALATLDRFEAAMNARDLDAIMATLTASKDLVLFLPMPYVPMRIDGAETGRRAFEILFENIPKMGSFRVTHHQTVLQGYGRVATAYTYLTLYMNGGAVPRRLLCRATMVLLKSEVGWRILHLHAGVLPELSDFLSQ